MHTAAHHEMHHETHHVLHADVQKQVTVVVLAAGSAARFGRDKMLATVLGRPVLRRTLESCSIPECVSDLVVVTQQSTLDEYRQRVQDWEIRKPVSFVVGGPQRQDSVYNALRALPESCEWVAVHDGARPLVTAGLFNAVYTAAQRVGAAVCGVPISSTVKSVDEDDLILKTVPRSHMWQAQTPQIFRRALLLHAHEAFRQRLRENAVQDTDVAVTDDAMLVEFVGHSVIMVRGSETNIKITTQEDAVLAEGILHARLMSREVDAVVGGAR
jgi:2-C-methyl-D-erythritol 4-phosphate cytidylyltransferase